jgi:hypothetical protein
LGERFFCTAKYFTPPAAGGGIVQALQHVDPRHRFVTNMRRAGVHDSVIMAQTGHKTMSMFQRYNRVDESGGKEAVQRLSDYLGISAEKSDINVRYEAF